MEKKEPILTPVKNSASEVENKRAVKESDEKIFNRLQGIDIHGRVIDLHKISPFLSAVSSS